MMVRRRGSGLTFSQVVMLGSGFLAASAVIFLFGVWVGRDFAECPQAEKITVVRRPVVRVTPASKTRRDPDITLYDKRRQPTTPPLRRAPAAAPPPPTKVAAPPRATAARHLPTPRRGTEWADAGWTVQVSATTEPREAEAIARRLRAKGYRAYTVRAPKRDRIWYRVRVGYFSGREEAKAMERRLRTRERMKHAYVTPR